MRRGSPRGREILRALRRKNRRRRGGRRLQKCGTRLLAGAKFCSECGTPVETLCPKCGAKLLENAKFCPECGEKLK
ncbi:MAG: zinc ribbon domain-containing protein [Christensenellaceae bacterium]